MIPSGTNNALFFAMFMVGADSNSEIPTNQNSYKPNSQRCPKQIKNKQQNILMRTQHRISQPQWRGYSH